MVDLVEMEALLIRARAARKLVRDRVLKGEEALALIVLPSPELLAQSRRIALEKGIHSDTVKFFGRRATADRGMASAVDHRGGEAPVAPPEASGRSQIVSIDDLVAQV